ncbi:MAG: DUF1043 family protein [Pseudomonadales bacterium]
MYTLEFLLTVGLAAIIIGLVGGFLIAQRTSASQQSQRELENHLSELQQQQQDYQHEVTEHFSETADLLNQLTTSYRDVHNHLARGAQLLAGENASESLKTLPENKVMQTDKTLDEDITPPLDYAPKTAPHEPGMLNEEFGLEKNSPDDKAESPLATDNGNK